MAKAPKRPKGPGRKARFNPGSGELPSQEAILEALASGAGIKGKRDLARHFGITGDMRVPFKVLIREMEDAGLIAGRRKQIRNTAELPAVAVLDIPADADPDHLIGFPASWNEVDGEKPGVLIRSNGRVVPGPGNRILARIERLSGPSPRYSAKPMKILEAARRAQIGIVRRDDQGARLVPVDRKQKEMRIDLSDLGSAADGDLVEVEIKAAGRLMIPKAKVLSVIGNPQSEGAISMIALYSLDIPHIFPEAVRVEVSAIKPVSPKGRTDWRAHPFVTIDPVTAKDHDDAVQAEPDTNPKNAGGFIVRVAIADVAAYVVAGSAIDREALNRGNSVYFPDRVVPMLPEEISNHLCSLIEGEDRPALGLEMIVDADGRKLRHSFHRVIIRSHAKLAYEQAQAAIDGQTDHQTEPLLAGVLLPLWNAYRALTKARDKRAPLDLDLPERKIELDDKGMVTGIRVPQRLEAHRLIEEMMILANVAAAETLEEKRIGFLYRTHDTPGREKLIALRAFLASLDLPFSQSDAVRTSHFNQVLAKARAAGSAEQVSEMVLRSQAQAEYSHENFGHFGLNLNRYAHFTSPIRRYADLIVHRALIAALGLGKDGLREQDVARLPEIGQHISSTERRAMNAERETSDRLLAQFLSSKLNARFDGRISGVVKSGLFVRLTETGADGFVPASTIGADYYHYVEAQQAMIGERTGERFRLGDAVEVRLLEAAPVAGALRFELLSEGERVTPPKGLRGRRPTTSRPRRQGRR